MTALRHALQKEVFTPADERLLSVVSVCKSGKKRKSCFLCAAVTTERPVQVSIVKVKKADRGELYKKQSTWLLRDLVVVDGRDPVKESAEFELHLDKVYKWVASSVADKHGFVSCLWKLNQRYLRKKIEFVGINPALLEEASGLGEGGGVSGGPGGTGGPDEAGEGDPPDDYQELTSREEGDIEKMMDECHTAIANAEAFAGRLSRELHVLDGANIQWIIASEQQVGTLMSLLDEALGEADRVERTLASYEDMLRSVRQQMEQVSQSNRLVQLAHANSRQLLQEVDYLVNQLNLSRGHVQALNQGDLTTSRGITACSAAAEALTQCMGVQLHPGHGKLQAVVEQKIKFETLRQNFTKRLSYHLNNMFVQQGIAGPGGPHVTGELSLPRHAAFQRDLLPYAMLMGWLKVTDQDVFTQLAKVYSQNLSRLYEKEIREFMEMAKQRLLTSSRDSRKLFTQRRPSLSRLESSQVAMSKLTGSSSSLNKLGGGGGGGAAGGGGAPTRGSASSSLSDVGNMSSSDLDISDHSKFDKIFEQVLVELEPACLAEQDFLCKFFNLQLPPPQPRTTQTQGTPTQGDTESDGLIASRQKLPPSSPDLPKEDAAILRQMMSEIFQCVELEVAGLIAVGDRVDALTSLHMLVKMSHHVWTAQSQDPTSFLSTTLGNVLVLIKRNFDRLISTQTRQMEEVKIGKKSKVAVLPFVSAFEEFAELAEGIFRSAERRGDLDKAYARLIRAVFDNVEKVAAESQKTPRDVVLMENYHHLFATLSRLKISSLDAERRDAKNKYAEHLQAYVTSYLGQPLPKLNVFFEGVEARVAQGVKADEVGYQLMFSKQELRKVLREYPGKEVKRGLENLYKKVDKHLCEEENLLQVVWHSMQEEFIRQYKHFEGLISRCYPGAGISMEFSIRDILDYFSQIAQAH
ncbi:exocyst complex component 1 isoform X2 [Petromyzon marinus]|uniref:Exocyst complex component 1 n=1 Tax=Petromyzon marinus TaxID=7757 RepID=A0AAJ7UDJ6_PETMA|nr:exocyst complex component 1 isoform X2 [Petromyzon marinus]